MSAVLEAQEPRAGYLVALQLPLVRQFDLLATASTGVARLRELILTLAVQGKLVPQLSSDEPATSVLARVRAAAAKQPCSTTQRSPTIKNEEPPAPYELPEKWTWARLGNLVENMGSGWSPACDERERNDSTRWAVLRTTAVQLMEYRPREHKAIPAKLSPRPEIEVKDGDILITRAGPMNRVGVSCCVDRTPARLMLSDKIVRFHSIADELFPPFVVLSLNAGWTKSQIEAAKSGMAASQVNISQSDLRNLWVPVCSKAEQSRIVTRVEELMRLCDALESQRQLETAQHAQLLSTLLGTLTDSTSPDELAANWQRVSDHFDLLLDRPQAVDVLEQTILQLAVRGLLVPQDPSDEPASVLLQRIRAERIKRNKPPPLSDIEQLSDALPAGWGITRFGTIFEGGSGTTPLRARSDYFLDGTEVWVKTTDLNNSLVTSCEELITKSAVNENRLNYFPAGTVCIAMYGGGGTIGKSGILGVPATINQSVFALPPVSGVLPDFLHIYVISIRSKWMSFAAGLRKDPNINGQIIKNMVMPVPPASEQTRIVERVAQLRTICADLRQRLSSRQTTQSHLAEALVEI